MIHVLNNLLEDLNGLENCFMMTGEDVLTINMILKKLNHQYKKTKAKKKTKQKKKWP